MDFDFTALPQQAQLVFLLVLVGVPIVAAIPIFFLSGWNLLLKKKASDADHRAFQADQRWYEACMKLYRFKEKEKERDLREKERDEADTEAFRRAEESIQHNADELNLLRLEEQTKALTFLVLANRAFLNASFRQNYAREHQQQVRNVLKDEWARQYWTLQKDQELFAHLQSTAPQVIEWFEARQDIILRADSLAVEPPPPPPQPPPRKKPSTKEFRKRKLAYEQVKIDDEDALSELEKQRRQRIFDDRDRDINAINERTDLTDKQKEERINDIKEAADVRLKEFTHETESEKVL